MLRKQSHFYSLLFIYISIFLDIKKLKNITRGKGGYNFEDLNPPGEWGAKWFLKIWGKNEKLGIERHVLVLFNQKFIYFPLKIIFFPSIQRINPFKISTLEKKFMGVGWGDG